MCWVSLRPTLEKYKIIIKCNEQMSQQDDLSPVPAVSMGTAETMSGTGNIGAGFLNNKVHQQICVAAYSSGSKRCFFFRS